MLSTADLEGMRGTAEESFPDVCSILRRELAPDGSGGQIESLVTLATDVPCRLSEAGNQITIEEREALSREYQRTLATATLAAGTDVVLTDVLGFPGHTYQIVAARPTHAWEIERRLIVVEVD